MVGMSLVQFFKVNIIAIISKRVIIPIQKTNWNMIDEVQVNVICINKLNKNNDQIFHDKTK